MRIDHFAYQRGTQTAVFGLALQAGIGLTLLLFGLISGDTAFSFGATYVLLGLFVWISLLITFHQHKLERLEALEEDELAAAREGTSSIFDAAADEQRVAARRLGLMHKWMMPLVSLLVALALAIASVGMIFRLWLVTTPDPEVMSPLGLTGQIGWGLAICLAFALIAFIFSRFVAGMAKQEAWQNLRGGAGYMVGNALVVLTIAAGLGFRIFGNDEAMLVIAWIIPVYMLLISVEMLLNFVLNLYRPRIPGEVPRPAFDSKLLSLLAAPDSIVRSLNEAVNYQFGFDITSSWGYQLLIRSFGWLVLIGLLVIVLLNTMVVVEPHQQAVRVRHGEIIGDVHHSGVLWKWPWPRETAVVVNVESVRELPLTATRHLRELDMPRWSGTASLWTHSLSQQAVGEEFRPFLVGATRLDDVMDDIGDLEGIDLDPLVGDEDEVEEGIDELFGLTDPDSADEVPTEVAAAEVVSRSYSLVDAEVIMQYRIRPDADGRGLREYLNFAPDTLSPRRMSSRTVREEILRHLALREISMQFADMTVDEVLSVGRRQLSRRMREHVQRVLDEAGAGVEVLAINIPLLRPAGDTAGEFHELAYRRQKRLETVAVAERQVVTRLATLVGDPETGRRVLEALDAYDALRDELGSTHERVLQKRVEIENTLISSSGMAGTSIRRAEADRWNELMIKRAQAERIRSRTAAYRASPRIYRQREIMRVYAQTLPGIRKYLVAIDPERAEIDMEFKELNPLVDFSLAIGEGDGN